MNEEQLYAEIAYYTALRKKYQKERRFRSVEGAQQNIDRCYDEIGKLRNSKV